MPKFKHVAGCHYIDNEEVPIGAVIESDGDLAKKWPGRFEEVAEPMRQSKAAMAERSMADKVEEEEEDEVESELGIDVTDAFPTARENDLRVFKDGGWYFVADEREIDEALNERGLRKKKVAEFIDDHLASLAAED